MTEVWRKCATRGCTNVTYKQLYAVPKIALLVKGNMFSDLAESEVKCATNNPKRSGQT